MSALGVSEGRALGCGLRLVVTEAGAIGSARAAVDHVVDAIDRACSRFRPDSELSRLTAAGGRPQHVSPIFGMAIVLGLRGAQLTDGAVDPTIGRALRLAGYDRDFDAVPPTGAALRLVATPVPGWQALHFDAPAGVVSLPPGVELDLGATAKGLAADLAAAAALGVAGGGVLVSLGGDIAAVGTPPPGGWQIEVGEDSGALLGAGDETISVGPSGVATSSTTVRRWTRGGVELHHLIDPRTGLPATGRWRTATVVAATCAERSPSVIRGMRTFARITSKIASTGSPRS